MFDNILLAVDGSDNALNAARYAGDMVRALNSKMLRVVIAYDPIPSYLGEPNLQNAIDARLGQANAILDAAVQVVGTVPIGVHTELIEGSPAEAIIDVATVRKVDIIIMGSRGLGRISGAVLGSTSQKVVAHAPCPVLIVR
ncbi:MAG: universal stress protein [Bacteroidota bacterium]